MTACTRFSCCRLSMPSTGAGGGSSSGYSERSGASFSPTSALACAAGAACLGASAIAARTPAGRERMVWATGRPYLRCASFVLGIEAGHTPSCAGWISLLTTRNKSKRIQAQLACARRARLPVGGSAGAFPHRPAPHATGCHTAAAHSSRSYSESSHIPRPQAPRSAARPAEAQCWQAPQQACRRT